jgi:hypothetical protein
VSRTLFLKLRRKWWLLHFYNLSKNHLSTVFNSYPFIRVFPREVGHERRKPCHADSDEEKGSLSIDNGLLSITAFAFSMRRASVCPRTSHLSTGRLAAGLGRKFSRGDSHQTRSSAQVTPTRGGTISAHVNQWTKKK